LIKDNRKFIDEGKRIYERERELPITDKQVQMFLNKFRGGKNV
jgi:hypothetical protein